MSTCPSCSKSASSPWRVYSENGKVLQGCVDAFHTGHIVTPSESNYWHNRPEAKKIRAALEKGRKGLGYGRVEKNPRVPVSMKLWKWDKTIGYWMLEKVITEPGTAQQWLAIHELDEPTTPYKLSRTKPRAKPTKNAHNTVKINPRNDMYKRAHNWEAYRDALVLAITAPTVAQSNRATKLAENFALTMTVKEQEQAKRYAQKIVKRETGSNPRKKAKRTPFIELCGARSGKCYLEADARYNSDLELKPIAQMLAKKHGEAIVAKRVKK